VFIQLFWVLKMPLEFSQLTLSPGSELLVKNVNWAMFENILVEIGETAAARLSYNNGLLEIMAPLPEHEDDKEIIGDLIKLLLEELQVEFRTLGSTTFKHQLMQYGVEPDQCFYIQHELVIRGKKRLDLTIDPPPDLALEIDLTSRTHFDNYEKLGVPELWRYDGKTLEIHVLQDGRYQVSKTSLHFPRLPLIEAIPYYVERSKVIGRNATMREFRRWLADHGVQIFRFGNPKAEDLDSSVD